MLYHFAAACQLFIDIFLVYYFFQAYRLLEVTLHFAQKAHSRLTILQALRVDCTYGKC